MSKKKHAPHPTPPGNRTTFGPAAQPPDDAAEAESQTSSEAGFNEQDPKRRLGGFETAGEHSIVQPRPLNDG